MHRTAINDTPGRDYVCMNINTGASAPSKFVIELFSDICPKICENFKQLCEGYSKSNDKAAEKMGYVGIEFHRVV
jgi:cyclophilin family peptidyl-prolyl cis-trans isomerase